MLKDDWLAALRSGKYTQARCALKNSYGFCCLGVACDVKDSTKWTKDPISSCQSYDDSKTGLSIEMLTELNLSLEQQRELILMNDTDKKTFNEIADWIEANVT